MDVSRQPRNSADGRIGELATLPVFLDLKGKPVLVAGESDGAAWKGELLASCGAEVHLFARQELASDAICALAARPGVVHHDCSWEEAYFKHFALAIGDCAPDEGRAFYERAREAGVPVNVIDQPEFCQFKFGSIVNRSPLVIGISTDGAAPVLAQTVRRKIEALLPRDLKRWAELAQAMRGRVNGLLEAVSLRRSFWERFADLAFDGSADTGEAENLLASVAKSANQRANGRISIVGSGPGDAELLTLKAVRAMQTADVILHDDQIPEEVLELARREARRVPVGGARSSSCRHDMVVETAADLARGGKRVVRLVAGDPADSFAARAEIAEFRRQALFVDVIPGVKSDDRIEVPQAVRMQAGSVHVLAGHYHRGGAPLPSAPARI